MCGVYGKFSRHGGLVRETAARAADRMAHRGPDDAGLWIADDGTVVLSHRRLSLIGIHNGHQPLQSEDGTIIAAVNGEFYGYREIRSSLESRGHIFRTDSDSEIIVHLYEERGLDCVRQLRGEFAALIWDGRLKRLVAIRDRFGIKPLVFSEKQGSVSFASEARALLPEMDTVEWDHEALFFATALQYLPVDRTLFAGIQQVPPGHAAIADADGLRMVRYWDFDFPDARQAERPVGDSDGHDTSVDQLRQLLMSSVADRLQSEARLCFHLSGGLDSGAVLGMATEILGREQTAFTMAFQDSRYDESEQASETARFNNARLHVERYSGDDLLEVLGDAVRAAEGLAINGHISAKYLLNRTIRQSGFKAVLTGEGADEVFAGYAHLRIDWWRSRQLLHDRKALEQSNRASIGMMLPHGSALPLQQIEDQLGYVPAFLEAKATLGFRLRSLLHPELEREWRQRDAFGMLAQSARQTGQLDGRTPLHKSTWLWSRLALAGYILRTLGDGTEMPASVEGRVPFLDHRLTEFCRALPVGMLIRETTEKFLLREAVRPFVPQSVYQREKHPFDAPPLIESRALQSRILEQTDSDEFRTQPFFCKRRLRELTRRLPSMSPLDRQAWDPPLMMVLSVIAIQSTITNYRRKGFNHAATN